MRRTIKDSVFTNLFSDKRYTLELYRSLHPEDSETGIDDIEIVTVQNVLTSGQHNDLGFIAGDRLLILVEAQSTWSPNIVLRALLYAAQTIKDYIRKHEIDIYHATPAAIPMPELYVVYTGSREDVPDHLTLSGELFAGEPSGIEITVNVLRAPGPSIEGQYIDFARTVDECRAACGPNEEAVRRATRQLHIARDSGGILTRA